MIRLLIEEDQSVHFECIESIIVKYKEILGIDKTAKIHLLLHRPNESFVKYIKHKYPKIMFSRPTKYDYHIVSTTYDIHYDEIEKNVANKFYISHDVSDRMQKLSNVRFITPLGRSFYYADCLPFAEDKIKSDIPIYIIQGNITNERRNYSLLVDILKKEYDYDFKIKMLGKGNGLPAELIPFRDKIILKTNLDFISFHKEFIDAYALIMPTTKQSQPQYYKNKLTSNISYAKGYSLTSIIDKELQDIYQLDNAYTYGDISKAFEQSLKDFYNR